ncbi:hypothetical protein [Streptomyces sp. NPDC091217]|uniref:hypothetical protein n=1 Tax=Streptomyces sp. NPDC091217 TaxID=3365975 RepID=UPI0037F8C6A4
MAKAFARSTRMSMFAATAGLALAVPFLPGAAHATSGDPTNPAGTGTPAAQMPPTPTQQSLIRRDARLAKAEQRPGVRQLRMQLGTQGVLDLDPATGTARQVAKLDGYLTPPSDADPADIVRDYLRAHPDVFGVPAAQVDALSVRRQYTDVAGIRHLFFVQSTDGVPVFGNGVKANISPDGRLISVLGSPVRNLPTAGLVPARVSGAQAKRTAVRDIAGAQADGTEGSGTVKQVVYPTSGGTARRAWQTVTSPEGHGMWLHVVDAATGRVLYRQNLSSDLKAAGTTDTAPAPGKSPVSSPAVPRAPTRCSSGTTHPAPRPAASSTPAT